MITLFTTTKRFVGIFDIIQKNALKNWREISPDIQILIIGDSQGSEEVASSINAEYIPEVESSLQGTPLLSSLFSIASDRAKYPIMAYINADILLPPNFLNIISILTGMEKKFLAVGHRWDIDINQSINSRDQELNELFWTNVKENAIKHACTGIDYFIFKKDTIKDIPDFAIGRFGWDNWLLWKARRIQIPLIDLTDNLFVVHQNHTYNYGGNRNKNEVKNSKDGRMNNRLIGNQYLNLLDCNYQLKNQKIHKNKSREFIMRNLHRLPIIFPEFSMFIKLYRIIYKRLIVNFINNY